MCLLIMLTSVCAGVNANQATLIYGDFTGYADVHKNLKVEEVRTYTADCSDSKTPEGFIYTDKKNSAVENGVLTCRQDSAFAIGSRYVYGDKFATQNTDISFDMSVIAGSLRAGVRLLHEKGDSSERGLWFTFSGNTLTVSEPDSGFSAEVESVPSVRGDTEVIIRDKNSSVELWINGTLVVTVFCYSFGDASRITVYSNEGKIGESTASAIESIGYFNIEADSLEGYIDNIKYTCCEVSEPVYTAEEPVDYSNWVATDDLGRTVMLCGDNVKVNKYVGVFYFLCLVGDGWPIIDHTKLYLERGIDGLKTFLEKREVTSYGNFWAEPYFGYYENTDEWVYRKHAAMLSSSGVDFVFLDISNPSTFNEAHITLFETWLKIRNEGGDTPQICFFTGDNAGRLNDHLTVLSTTVYSEEGFERYRDLFFMWEGKPLIFGLPRMNMTDSEKALLDKFTVRQSWAWKDEPGYWCWLSEYPQIRGRNKDDVFEQMTVTAGHHPATSKGRSYLNGVQPNNGKNDFEFSSDTARLGLCLSQQFEYAIEADPSVIMVTGWNEWIAGHFSDNTTYFANTEVNGYEFIDQFNPEFSRDIEPMKLRDGVGFGDNYYYLMSKYISEYKGAGGAAEAVGEYIDMKALSDLSVWNNVTPKFTDTINDTVYRSHAAFNHKSYYVNNTGVNDIVYARTAQDRNNIYFWVSAAEDIIQYDTVGFMNLYIDIDCDHTTGWEGYDFRICKAHEDGDMYILRYNDKISEFVEYGKAEYYVSGKEMTLAMPKKCIDMYGVNNVKVLSFDFKWADNSTVTYNVMQFMDLGDAAPDSRYNFRYTGTGTLSDGALRLWGIWAACAVAAAALAAFSASAVRRKLRRKNIAV